MADRKAALAAGGLGLAGLVTYMLTRKVKAAPPPPLPGRANLYGVVTDAVSGKKVPGVLAILNSMQTFTDTQGNYSFADIEPGEYRLEFSKDGYETVVK